MKKGALVNLVPIGGASLPNVAIFQFNPETVRHGWSQGSAGGDSSARRRRSNGLAVAGAPSESFSFSLSMDAADQHTDAHPNVRRDAQQHGLYARLAALELMLHPSPISALLAPGRTTPAAQLPVVLFVWGTTRIVPVRVTSLTNTEKLYDADLNPTHAEAQIDLSVLTPEELRAVTGPAGALAVAAYQYSLSARVVLAAVNLGTTTSGVIHTAPSDILSALAKLPTP